MKAVTHDGIFHADDVLAFAMLRMLYAEITLKRTRDPEEIAKADVVFDIGGKYDVPSKRFDHHQRGGAGERENGIPYASAGLVWKAYGRLIVASYAAGKKVTVNVEEVASAVDRAIVQCVDALDNGHDIKLPKGEGSVPVRVLTHLVSACNPAWFEPTQPDADMSGAMFTAATGLANQSLKNTIKSCIGHHLAKSRVESAWTEKGERILMLGPYCPWESHVLRLDTEKKIWFVVFFNPIKDQWLVKQVPVESGSFEGRWPLPTSWAGLNDGELAAASGVEDAIFCHRQRFLCAAKTQAGAMAMADAAVKNVVDGLAEGAATAAEETAKL